MERFTPVIDVGGEGAVLDDSTCISEWDSTENESIGAQWDSSENIADALATVMPKGKRLLEAEEPGITGVVSEPIDPEACRRQMVMDAIELDCDSDATSMGGMETNEVNQQLADVLELLGDTELELLEELVLPKTDITAKTVHSEQK